MGIALRPSNTLAHHRTTTVQCGIAKRLMSALGQKRILKRFHPMSALPPKADIAGRQFHVRFVPKAEVGRCLDIKAFSRYDDGHNLPLAVAGATVSIATNPTRAYPG
jgi:hypothetical protein